MAVPFRRISKTRKRKRRSHLRLSPLTLTTCKECGTAIKMHRACSNCGSYKGKVVIEKN